MTDVLSLREILVTLARSVLVEFGPPDDRLSPAEAVVYDRRLDEGATMAVGAPSLTDWRLGTSQTQRWRTARDQFEELLTAVWNYDGLRGDLPGPATAEEAYGPDVAWTAGLERSEADLDDLLRALVPATVEAVSDPWQVAC